MNVFKKTVRSGISLLALMLVVSSLFGCTDVKTDSGEVLDSVTTTLVASTTSVAEEETTLTTTASTTEVLASSTTTVTTTEKPTTTTTVKTTTETTGKKTEVTTTETKTTTTVKVTEATTIAQQQGVMVWIPTNGGKRYHCKETCSNMIDPQYVTIEQAQQEGFTPCGRCYK